jgi:hypothetical protein
MVDFDQLLDGAVRDSGATDIPPDIPPDKRRTAIGGATAPTDVWKADSHSVHMDTRRARELDKRADKALGVGGKSSLTTRPFAHQRRAARQVFESTTNKARWAVEACALLRDQGQCQVCGESVRGKWFIRQVEPRARGGRFEEPNVIVVCRHCDECWFPYRSFNAGLGLDDTLRQLQLAILERRRRGFHDVKDLDIGGKDRWFRLRKQQQVAQRQMEERLKQITQ